MRASVVFVPWLYIALGVAANEDSDIQKAMENMEVVPDVLDKAPKEALKITYDSGVEVDKGNDLTPTQVKNAPMVTWHAKAGALYTLLKVDPDAPSRNNPTLRSFLHWKVINIPGNAIDKADIVADYVGAAPPAGSGFHRYVYLVYQQTHHLPNNEPHIPKNSMDGRPNFCARDFAAKHGLGQPIAGNFYQAQWDDYVPTIHEQLGFTPE